MVGHFKPLDGLPKVIGRDETVEGRVHLIANVLWLSTDQLLLLPLDIVFLFSVVRDDQLVDVLHKFLLHARLQGFKTIRKEVVARFDVFVAAELDCPAETGHTLVDIIAYLRVTRLSLREQNDYHVL